MKSKTLVIALIVFSILIVIAAISFASSPPAYCGDDCGETYNPCILCGDEEPDPEEPEPTPIPVPCLCAPPSFIPTIPVDPSYPPGPTPTPTPSAGILTITVNSFI